MAQKVMSIPALTETRTGPAQTDDAHDDALARVWAGVRDFGAERLALALDAAEVGVYELFHETGDIIASGESRAHHGFRPEEAITLSGFFERVHPEDRERVRAAVLHAFDPSGNGRFLAEYRTMDAITGQLRWVSGWGHVTFGPDGRPLRALGASRDNTVQHQAELALQQQLQLTACIAHQSTDAILVADQNGQVSFVNTEAERFLGYSLAEYREFGIHELLHPGRCAVEPSGCALLRVAGSRETCRDEEVVLFAKSGGSRDVSMSSGPLQVGSSPFGVVLTFRDISERKRARQALLDSEARFMRLVESDVVGVVLGDGDTVREANEYFLQMIGYTRQQLEAGLITWNGITVPEHLPLCARVREVIRDTGLCPTFEKEYMRPDGTRIPVMVGGTRTHAGPDYRFMLLVIDQTERKALEGRIRQAEKLEGITQLAGGVAHDFNNLLTIISGYSRRLVGKLDLGTPARDHAYEIHSAALKAIDLTRQLLAFSRRQTGEPTVLHLADLVRELGARLKGAAGDGIEVLISVAPDTGWIRADASQIELVLNNLLANACDAMPDGGKLFIETSRMAVSTPFAALCMGAPEGDYVMLAVSDTGCGMSPAVQARIFDPFFTTKTQGRGTGLGLSTVYGIVRQGGGHIRVHSTPGVGTAFRLLFPAVETTQPSQTPVVAEGGTRGTETILLVDDEPGLRKFVRELLDAQGYQTLDAGSGPDALSMAEHYRGPIHLLLTDIVLPEMSGVEIIRRFRAFRPDTPVLRMSGYTDRFGIDMDADTPYIQKPFNEVTLLRRVRELLDSGLDRPVNL